MNKLFCLLCILHAVMCVLRETRGGTLQTIKYHVQETFQSSLVTEEVEKNFEVGFNLLGY